MLTNYDLEELCDVYNVPLRGIYMKDMLPRKIQNGNYIINLESSNGGQNNGTHWTCLVVSNKDTMFYDPYGASNNSILSYLLKDDVFGWSSTQRYRRAFNRKLIREFSKFLARNIFSCYSREEKSKGKNATI